MHFVWMSFLLLLCYLVVHSFTFLLSLHSYDSIVSPLNPFQITFLEPRQSSNKKKFLIWKKRKSFSEYCWSFYFTLFFISSLDFSRKEILSFLEHITLVMPQETSIEMHLHSHMCPVSRPNVLSSDWQGHQKPFPLNTIREVVGTIKKDKVVYWSHSFSTKISVIIQRVLGRLGAQSIGETSACMNHSYTKQALLLLLWWAVIKK